MLNPNNDMLNNITNLMDDILFNGININSSINNGINSNINSQSPKSTNKKEYDILELKVNLDDIINSNKKSIKYKIKDVCSW